ncbi:MULTISPECIES: serine--tRNA ligase [Actinotignum]|uniref:Serine--tRNA ligase n=1 Tax=Actinotignum timonense TaxID=1870995 RepID=A0AAW9HDZ3_9ACTO|nr:MULTISPECIES: serine--tRNA ligase [Actinotignum]MDE1559253.1 serine--tRNA ligase [Actinotignum schaalii]MDE1664232.1 serine--tRNA ligase [Actinotignum schaalii]MDK6373685.1 serine--tRNA ligase [Actinotignum timonense]MDK6419375.1 serine--tRNA ligase [Actinotignum timonense]MDK6591001.1 serine--tRNA ligase [Actinotignum timonense]
MLDMRSVRENPEAIRESQRRRGNDPATVDALLAADDARRTTLQEFEAARAEQKEVSRSVGKASPEERPAVLAHAKELAEKVKALDAAAAEAEETYLAANRAIENPVLAGVPAGGEDDYEVLEVIGTPRDFEAEGFTPKDHLDIAEGLGALDMDRGAKVSGSRFYYLKGVGAHLEMAMFRMAIDQAAEHGFTLMTTPTIVNPDIMSGTGFLGEHSDEIYYLGADDQYLVGTSEVPLAGYHKDEILELDGKPRRYCGYSACYRREAGSYGKDTRGIIRVHQFNKVEMFSYCPVEQSEEEHRALLAMEREMIGKMELPYRIINVAAGDLGSSAAQKFDCEAWLPTQHRYMEVTSTSNCTTYQARRLNVRERVDGKTRAVATLNGTLATTRWLVALFENHQQKDGSLYVPDALRPYLGAGLAGREFIEPVK